MSPNDFDPIREAFAAAAARLGWKPHSYKEYHERDWDCYSTVEGWTDAQGNWLIGLSDLTEHLAHELIRIAVRLPVA